MDDAMYKFLRERGVTESGIDDLKKDTVIIINQLPEVFWQSMAI